MSEYIDIDADYNEEDGTIEFTTNLVLSDEGEERYPSISAMAEGSPVAQALAIVEGIAHLHIEGNDMTITPTADAPWHSIVAEVVALLKDFFL